VFLQVNLALQAGFHSFFAKRGLHPSNNNSFRQVVVGNIGLALLLRVAHSAVGAGAVGVIGSGDVVMHRDNKAVSGQAIHLGNLPVECSHNIFFGLG